MAHDSLSLQIVHLVVISSLTGGANWCLYICQAKHNKYRDSIFDKIKISEVFVRIPVNLDMHRGTCRFATSNGPALVWIMGGGGQ